MARTESTVSGRACVGPVIRNRVIDHVMDVWFPMILADDVQFQPVVIPGSLQRKPNPISRLTTGSVPQANELNMVAF